MATEKAGMLGRMTKYYFSMTKFSWA